jgi:hypothetical protein
MSIVRIEPDDIERYELLANPRVYFASSSSGITGSLPLFADGSAALKDVYESSGLYAAPKNTGGGFLAASAFKDSGVEGVRGEALAKVYGGTSSPITSELENYMSTINALTGSTKFSKNQEVIRFEPSTKLDTNFIRKKIVRQSLFPFYRSMYPKCQWNYTNYHSINFVTCSNYPSESVIIYPAGTGTYALEDQNALAPSSSFTFDFYINPRYSQESAGESFRAGTILHMSSCYAVSLITGSQVGSDGKSSGFRLLLQLSQSAEIPPSKCKISGNNVTAPGVTTDPGFLFVSNDNSLLLNNWHHVGIRWGGPSVNSGTGSIVIDGANQCSFTITSQSCMQATAPAGTALSDPDALFVGNFFEGRNAGSDIIAGYFNPAAVADEGVTPFGSINDSGLSDPQDAVFDHPLNAEIHDLKIFNTYRNDEQISQTSTRGYQFVTSSVSMTGSQDLIFYVPPFFVKDVPTRQVLQTPFQSTLTTTDDPFNVSLSFGVAGHDINLENFMTEFVRGVHPRLLNLTSSEISNTTTDAQPANTFLFSEPSIRKRNVTVLPCDNGKFYPNFSILLTGGLTQAQIGNSLDRFMSDFGTTDLSIIKLIDLVSPNLSLKISDPSDSFTNSTGSLFFPILVSSVSPSGRIEPGVSQGQFLTVLQNTADTSSNEVVFFDISNMFYGDRIKPGSVVLRDLSVTGSNGRVKITLRDDGYGNLHRGDSLTPHAKWSSVGNVIYEEGIIVVKTPNLPMFGSDSWEISFEGERYIHVYEVNVPAPKSFINSSSNPTYKPMIPSDYPSENASSFVYITGIQLHDENLNVVGRSTLAQPVIKRDGDRIIFRLRMDY